MNKIEKAVIELDGVWPVWDIDAEEYPYLVLDILGNYMAFSCAPSREEYICTYSEFMKCRASLENKPPESEWPEWRRRNNYGY